MSSIEEKKKKRSAFLKKLYEMTGGNSLRVVSMDAVGKEIGIDYSTIHGIVEYLAQENYIRGWVGREINITIEGVKLIESQNEQNEKATPVVAEPEIPPLHLPTSKFIDDNDLPDPFYRELVAEINILNSSNLPKSLSVMIRKLFENLILDILRRKYGTSKLTLYYWIDKGRPHDFSVLLENLKQNLADFKPISTTLDKTIIDRIGKFKERGDNGTHSIEANISIEAINKDRNDINYLVQLLVRILKNISN